LFHCLGFMESGADVFARPARVFSGGCEPGPPLHWSPPAISTVAHFVVVVVLASLVHTSVSVMGDADPPPPPQHVIAPSLVVGRLAAIESADAPWSPPTSPPSVVASNGLVEQTPLTVDWLSSSSLTSLKPEPASPSVNNRLFEDRFTGLPKLEDEHLSLEVLLHIAYEVVS
jgi:hypothetical protein